jgi:branched-chain amino acid transport system permease protein
MVSQQTLGQRGTGGLTWQKIIQYGFISGIGVLYVGLVGMVEIFHKRQVLLGDLPFGQEPVTLSLSLGRSLLVLIGVGMGYFVASRLRGRPLGQVFLASVGVGLISSLITMLLILGTAPLNMRAMFVNASPALLDILLFSQEARAMGLLLLFIFLMALHSFGAAIYRLPELSRRVVVTGLSAVLIIGMLQELLKVILSRSDLTKPVADFLFAQSGLSLSGALVIFLFFGGGQALWISQGGRLTTGLSRLPAGSQRVVNGGGIVIGILFLLFLPQLVGSYISQILVLVGLFILMGLGLNIEIGLAGLLDLGFVGFYAIGAYIVGLFTTTSALGLATVVAGQPTGASYSTFWFAIPFAVAVSALAGVFLGIPVLRMRGDYLAIVTLGLAEIIRILVLSDFLRPILGGAQGILNIPKPVIAFLDFTVNTPGHFYYLIVLGCVIIAFIAWRLQYARIGRNWMALREDEDVAEAMGINLIASKLLAFGIGAAFAGLAGAIFAAQVGSIFPHSFQLLISINVVSLVIIGGVGSIPGVLVGALVLVGLPELLREFAEFRLLIYGALLIVMMLVRPEGLWPSEVTRRELSDIDELEPVVGS